MVRPSNSAPFILETASFASSLVEKVTKPKPLLLPVLRSRTTRVLSRVPNLEKVFDKLLSSVFQLSPPTNTVVPLDIPIRIRKRFSKGKPTHTTHAATEGMTSPWSKRNTHTTPRTNTVPTTAATKQQSHAAGGGDAGNLPGLKAERCPEPHRGLCNSPWTDLKTVHLPC